MKSLSSSLSGARRSALMLLLAFALSSILISCFKPSLESLEAFFLGPFESAYAFGNMLDAAVGISFSALGAALAFKGGVINLGGEGFVYSGAVLGFICGYKLPGAWGWLATCLMTLAAFLSCASLGSIPALIRKASGRDELISSFLLSQALIPILDWAVSSPLRDGSSQIIATSPLPSAFRPFRLLVPSDLNASLLILLLACLCAYLALYRSRWGFELRMSGSSPPFARSIGLDVPSLRAWAMSLSSGIMGAGGFLLMAGSHGRVIKSFSAGLGWSGLACAIVARSNPLLLPFAALLFAYLDSGTNAARLVSGLPEEAASLVQAIVFFAAASEGFPRKRRSDA
jgi:simple sugar transport system permease protein